MSDFEYNETDPAGAANGDYAPPAEEEAQFNVRPPCVCVCVPCLAGHALARVSRAGLCGR